MVGLGSDSGHLPNRHAVAVHSLKSVSALYVSRSGLDACRLLRLTGTEDPDALSMARRSPHPDPATILLDYGVH